jgi:hypothetical protein
MCNAKKFINSISKAMHSTHCTFNNRLMVLVKLN